MRQNTVFSTKNTKNFLRRGTAPSQTPPQWGGDTSCPRPTSSAPTALRPHAEILGTPLAGPLTEKARRPYVERLCLGLWCQSRWVSGCAHPQLIWGVGYRNHTPSFQTNTGNNVGSPNIFVDIQCAVF